MDHATEWFSDAIRHAIQRGECVVVETGSWEAIPTPYALACARQGPNGWEMYVEAEPSPNILHWPPKDENQANLSAPLNDGTLGVVGLLVLEAISVWARSPLDVVLTFVPFPDGAVHMP